MLLQVKILGVTLCMVTQLWAQSQDAPRSDPFVSGGLGIRLDKLAYVAAALQRPLSCGEKGDFGGDICVSSSRDSSPILGALSKDGIVGKATFYVEPSDIQAIGLGFTYLRPALGSDKNEERALKEFMKFRSSAAATLDVLIERLSLHFENRSTPIGNFMSVALTKADESASDPPRPTPQPTLSQRGQGANATGPMLQHFRTGGEIPASLLAVLPKPRSGPPDHYELVCALTAEGVNYYLLYQLASDGNASGYLLYRQNASRFELLTISNGSVFPLKSELGVAPYIQQALQSALKSFVSQKVQSTQSTAGPSPNEQRLSWMQDGFSIPEFTISPNRKYGVTAPDKARYIWPTPNGFAPQNKLVEVASGKVLTTIQAFPAFVDGHARMNRGDLDASRWSVDNTILLWEVEGRWAPAALVVIKLQHEAVAWQVDLLRSAQQELLERTRKAVPDRYATIERVSANGYGPFHSEYPDGFAVNVRVEGEKGPKEKANLQRDPVSLPLHVHAELFSNPKSLSNIPDVSSQLDGVLNDSGQFSVTRFEMRKHPHSHAGAQAWSEITSPPIELNHKDGDAYETRRNEMASAEPTANLRANSIKGLIAQYGATQLADINVQFATGKFYQIARVKVAQVGPDFVLTTWEERHSVGGDFQNLVSEDKPFAVLTFKNSHALDDFNLAPGSYIYAVGQFVKFGAFDMTGGFSQRLPVFECVGLDVNGRFIDTR